MKTISQAEIQIIQQSSPEEKLQYFINETIANHFLFTIRNDESVLSFYDDQSNPCIPFYPYPEFSAAVIENGWKDCYPTKIPLHDFLHHWLPGMDKDGVQVALYPDPQREILLLTAKELMQKLNHSHDKNCNHNH
jgi:hypothetical protein